jgi:hypothetical protein
MSLVVLSPAIAGWTKEKETTGAPPLGARVRAGVIPLLVQPGQRFLSDLAVFQRLR